MKLATYKNKSRDGELRVVSRDLTRCQAVPHLAPSLQILLDDWDALAPQVLEVYEALNHADYSVARHAEAFEPARCMAPIPRATQWADGSAYVNHVELVRKARGAEMPPEFWTDPLMYQGGSDAFIGPTDDVPLADETWGIDFEGEIAIVTGDVPMGVTAGEARKHIRLLMLVNDVSLRNLIPNELSKGFGFFQSKPSSSFSPVAVTPDELGDLWYEAKVHAPLIVHYNNVLFGQPNAGVDMTFDFSQLIAHAAKTRPLGCGAIIGSGTISNKENGGPGKPAAQGGIGYSCIAEQRTIETITSGKAITPFMKFGDRVRIELFDARGMSVFGAIDQQIVQYLGARSFAWLGKSTTEPVDEEVE